MNASVAIYKDSYPEQVERLFAANKLVKIDFSNPDNVDAFVLREYSRLHLHLKGQHVFSERDAVWARMDIHSTGHVVHTIFFIKHDEMANLSPRTTVQRHDAIITYEPKVAANDGKASVNAKNSTLSANELFNMPDFFFRPRFKGRVTPRPSLGGLFRPSLDKIRTFFGPKIGLQ